MFNFFINLWQDIKQMFADIKNKKKFKQDIDLEIADPKSKYTLYKLSHDKDYERISAIIDIPDEFQTAGTDIDKQNKLRELVRPITQYLGIELQWAEYMYAPEFYYIEDPLDMNVSRTYIAIWKFAPVILGSGKFWFKFISTLICLIGIITGIIFFVLL